MTATHSPPSADSAAVLQPAPITLWVKKEAYDLGMLHLALV